MGVSSSTSNSSTLPLDLYVLAVAEATIAAAGTAEAAGATKFAGIVVPTMEGTGVVMVSRMTVFKLAATSLLALGRDARALSLVPCW